MGLGLSLGTPTGGPGTGGSGEPVPPEGFVYLVDAGGEYLTDADGALLMAVA
jgi:hypothetical protein